MIYIRAIDYWLNGRPVTVVFELGDEIITIPLTRTKMPKGIRAMVV